MKIVKLQIENFLVIGEAEVDLKDRGLMLVQGVNDDDSSASSNGAGKSSIADAICWGIYGVTARDVSGDDVVNDKVSKDCSVIVTIEDGDERYQIMRFRKHKDFKNALMLGKYVNEKGGYYNDITKGTTALTQEAINKIMGCSVEVFRSAVYAGQEQMPDLPGMTDKQLKLIIEEAAGTDRLERALIEANARNKRAKDEYHGIKKEIAKTLEGIERVKASMEKAKEDDLKAQAEFEAKRAEKIARLSADAETRRGESITLMGEISRLSSVAYYEIEIDSVNKEIDAIKAALDKANTEGEGVNRLISDTQTALRMKEKEISDTKHKISHIKSEIDNAVSIVGTGCKECGKEYHEEDVADFVAHKKDELRTLLLLVKDKLLIELESVRKSSVDAQNLKIDIKPISDSLFKKIALRDTLQSDLNRLNKLHERVNNLEGEVDLLTKKITETQLMERESSFISTFFDDERERLENELVSLKLAEHRADKWVQVTQDAQFVFGRAGIRAHILDNVTPFLNERTADYLSTLTDGNISAIWTTLTATAKGELREKFGIEVSKVNGAKSFKGLSGGEKRKVRIATAMALRDFVATRASKPIMFQFFDEIDDALDSSGLERLMSILVKKGREVGTVLIISHNDLNSYLPVSITVKNKGGISYIES